MYLPLEKDVALYLKKNWPSASGEEDEDVKSLMVQNYLKDGRQVIRKHRHLFCTWVIPTSLLI